MKRIPGRSAEEIEDDSILLRAYGHDTDILIDRNREAQSHALLAEQGLAPPLLARFNNGLMYKFIRGRVCTPQDLQQEKVWRGVSRRLAEFHRVTIPDDYQSKTQAHGSDTKRSINNGIINGFKHSGKKPTPNVWTTMQKWINVLPIETDAERNRQDQLQHEFDFSVEQFNHKCAFRSGHGMVFGHCDLLSANIIILPSKRPTNGSNSQQPENVRFIDYEYATACPSAFDIANHFAEWAGYDCDYTNLPSRKVRSAFLEEYLRALLVLPPNVDVGENQIQALNSQVDDFRGIPGLYWGIWALIQGTISEIDFDYASYAEIRLDEYFAWRREQDGSRKRGGQLMPLREKYWDRAC